MNILIAGRCRAGYAAGEVVKSMVEKAWFGGHHILLPDLPGVAAVAAHYAERIGATYTVYGIEPKPVSRAICYTCLPGTILQRDNWLLTVADMVLCVDSSYLYHRAVRLGKKAALKRTRGVRQ